MKNFLIIGGGISGLSAAHRLIELGTSSESAFSVTLLEASARLGGSIQTEQRDGFLIERGPDSFISEKPEAVSLAGRLGIESSLIQTNSKFRRSFIVRNGRLRPVPEGFQLLAPGRVWPFMTTDIFSFIGKARMAADLLLPRAECDDESLASFVRRRLGREALDRMAQPMVGGIYTADPEKLSLRATLPRFLEMEREHRSIILAMMRNSNPVSKSTGVSGARYSLFLSLDRGVQLLVDELRKKIGEYPHINLAVNSKAELLTRDPDNHWNVRTNDQRTIKADGVCLALPSYAAAKLLQTTNPTLASRLDQIQFASTATVNLAYRRNGIAHPLNGFGFVVPFVEKRSLIACTFSSIKFAGRAPDDHVLLRAFVGGALQPEMFALSEDEIVDRVKLDLRNLLGTSSEPLFTQVSKWSNSMPQYEVGHLARIQAIEDEISNLPGLTIAGNSYRGAGIPDCIRSGEKAAEEMLADGG
jgi:oxygen-dependent protoporphyrinogen oxidase